MISVYTLNKKQVPPSVSLLAISAAFLSVLAPPCPAQVPTLGLKLWLKADAGVTQNAGKVSRWSDQSNSGTNAVQASAANQPTFVPKAANGNPVIRFDGTSSYLTFTLPVSGLSQMSIVLVSAAMQNLDGGTFGVQNAPIFWNETGTWGTVHLSPFQGVVRYRFGTGQSVNVPSYKRPMSIGSAFSVTTTIKNGSAESLYADGALVATQLGKLKTIANTGSVGQLGMGFGASYFPGDIAEVLVYTRALKDSERQQIEAYLAAKYVGTAPPAPTNAPPTVNAGPDQTITAPGSITLNGQASDDGLPTGTLTTTWSQVNGPGTVAFANASALTTTASFSTSGTYVLQLTASDGQLTATDQLTVTVNSSGVSIPTQNLSLWLRADTGVILSSTSKVSRWVDQSGTQTDATQPLDANQPSLVSNVLNGKPVVRFDGATSYMGFTMPANGLTAMTLILVSATTQNLNDGNGGSYAPLYWPETAPWGMIYVSPLQSALRWRFGTGQTENLPTYTRPVSLGNQFSLSTVIKNASVESAYINGQAAATVSTALPAITNVSSSANLGRCTYYNTFFPGDIAEVLVYTRALSDSERQQVEGYLAQKYGSALTTPLPPQVNQPPTVSAGANQTITLPASATLNGSATDDGLPNATLTTTWSVVSGPGTVAFGDPHAPSTAATFSAAGSYVLRLSASDGQLTSSSDVTITVNAAPAPPPSTTAIVPADAGVINVKSYGAKGDGVTDDTQAILAAMRAAFPPLPRNGIVYFPNGTYLIGNSLIWKTCVDGTTGCTGYQGFRAYVSFQGQSQSGTIIRLRDNAPGFTDPAAPKPMLWVGSEQNDAQRADGGGDEAYLNNIRDLTIDAGSGNAGAIGLYYIGNNQSSVRNVTIKSSDPQYRGVRGLDLLRTWTGPQLIKNLTVDGFDTAIAIGGAYSGATFENIQMMHQRIAGFVNTDNIVSIRGLVSNNSVPAVQNLGTQGLLTLIEANLSGGTAKAAIQNTTSKLFARQITTSGYSYAIDNNGLLTPGPTVDEFTSHPAITLRTGTAPRSLRLPIQDTPELNDPNFANWANVRSYGAVPDDLGDDTAAIQAAIDSGKTVVYFPSGRYRVGSTIHVRASVLRIVGFGVTITPLNGTSATATGSPAFRFEGTNADVMLESIQLRPNYDVTGFPSFSSPNIMHASPRKVVLRSIMGIDYQNVAGAGPVFLEDVCCGPFTFNQQTAWARQFNVETGNTMHVTNNGGTLWVLNYKTEGVSTLMDMKAGAKTEILGGFHSSWQKYPSDTRAMYVSTDSSYSVGFATIPFGDNDFGILVQDVRSGTTTNNLYRAGSANTPKAYPRSSGSIAPLIVSTMP